MFKEQTPLEFFEGLHELVARVKTEAFMDGEMDKASEVRHYRQGLEGACSLLRDAMVEVADDEPIKQFLSHWSGQ